jgi:3-oxoacyl-[acyl-carrier protein] reductase
MNRNIVITGASSAIGAAICRRVANPGDTVLLHCLRNEDACRRLAGELDASCRVLKADFANSADLETLCRESADADILINCAAVTRTGLLAQMPDDDLQAMLNANITALVKLCRAVLPGMLTRRTGCIVNISSVAAARGNPGQAVYAGTKGFMEAFTRSLAAEYGPKGVRANCVAPGAIEVGSLKELLAIAPDEVRQNSALRRLGTAGDVAAAVAFLCSDEAGFISGRTLAVDGGFSRGV